jgi:hypothetical protein
MEKMIMILLSEDKIRELVYKDKTKSYTYGLCRNDGTLYYVGVGIRNRVLRHVKEHELKQGSNRLKNNITMKEQSIGSVKFVLFLLHSDRNQCLKLERQIIEKFGRIIGNTGSLSNLTNGGEIAPTGIVLTDITRQRISAARLRDKENLSLKNKLWWQNLPEEEKNQKITKLVSNANNEKAREKIGKATKLRWSDPEYKRRLSEIQKESQKLNSEMMSSIIKNKWADPEFREKMLKARKEARERKLAALASSAERQTFANVDNLN